MGCKQWWRRPCYRRLMGFTVCPAAALVQVPPLCLFGSLDYELLHFTSLFHGGLVARALGPSRTVRRGAVTWCLGTLRMGGRRKNGLSGFSSGFTEPSGPENEVKGNEDVIHSVTGDGCLPHELALTKSMSRS